MYESDDKQVSHPEHYQSETGLEVIDVIEAFTFDLNGIEATDTGNILKYACRWKKKNGVQDLKKIMWYTQHLIDHIEKGEQKVMKKNEIMKTMTSMVHKTTFQMKKYSPEILIVAGVIGTVASTVLACKATTKLSTIMDESKNDIEAIHKCSEDENMADQYSKEDAKKDLAIVYAQTGLKVAKLYAPAVTLGVLSITGIVASNQILRKRNVALAAAYATVDKTFKEYRSRVIDRFGEQVDKELRYNIKAKKFEEMVTDPETGKEKKVKSTVEVADPTSSPFAMFFDETTSKAYEENDDYNRMTLRATQQLANDKLHTDGYLFLNDVYDALGIQRTKMGQIVGWVDKPDEEGRDGYVDFRVIETNRETEDGGYKKAWLLDFNVDGNILDLI